VYFGEVRIWGERDVDSEHFGSFLKQRRVARGISIAELSRATKIKERSLELLEAARLDALPATVFVRGFVSAYARQVGADEGDALRRLDERLGPPAPAPTVEEVPPPSASLDELPVGRRFGVALVVLLLLIVATLTLSLLLRHGGAPGGLS
jgi:cytoskeletal protein RodZ